MGSAILRSTLSCPLCQETTQLPKRRNGVMYLKRNVHPGLLLGVWMSWATFVLFPTALFSSAKCDFVSWMIWDYHRMKSEDYLRNYKPNRCKSVRRSPDLICKTLSSSYGNMHSRHVVGVKRAKLPVAASRPPFDFIFFHFEKGMFRWMVLLQSIGNIFS